MKHPSLRRLLQVGAAALACLCLLFAGHKALRLWQLQTLFAPERIVENFRSLPALFDFHDIHRSGPVLPLAAAPQALPSGFEFQGQRVVLNEWLERTGTTGLLVLADDQVAYEDYFQGNSAETQVISWSVGKSFVSALVGMALADGSIRSLRDPVSDYAPVLKGSGYEGVALQDVLEMASGIDFSEDYADPEAGINQLGRTIALGRSTDDWIAQLQRDQPAGRKHDYLSVDTQVLGMVLKGATGKSLTEYMQEKLWSRLGVEGDGRWLTDAQGMELAFGGLNLRLRDYARFGLLYLHGGSNLAGEQLLPEQWVEDSVRPRQAYLQPGRFQEEGQPNLGYGYQWWIPQSEEGEFMAIGVYGQFIYVNPARQVVIAKSSAYADYHHDGTRMEYESLAAFRAIARQVAGREG
ncbi:serine hydrolase [Pseudomonas sp. 2FE]|uniref:serine hydrolase domain-containing protein n=1 Tax=Pseudomonas sp. 2FE TaxID=2502190 RepID=UPI0010F6116C|nr:serine hydrolase [Pseudomonas sp. 2FE]